MRPDFYPRPPRGGRRMSSSSSPTARWISIHASARRATCPFAALLYSTMISIHAPRGGRLRLPCLGCGYKAISIHALREEGGLNGGGYKMGLKRFLSTPSARRATKTAKKFSAAPKFLSTPSARRATAKTETKSLFSNKLYNILHEFRRALIYNGSKNYPNHAK